MNKHNDDINIQTDDPEVWWKLNQQKTFNQADNNVESELKPYVEEVNTHNKMGFWSHFKLQLFIAIVLFIGFVFLQKVNEDKPLLLFSWIENAIQDDIPFTKLSTWYVNTFSGSPSFIPIFDNKSQQVMSRQANEPLPLPVSDSLIIRSFADSLTGLELATSQGAEVFSVDEGRVVFVRDEGDTVIIQHSNQYVSIYAKLASTAVELNQWIKAGEKIGRMSPVQQKPILFYAIKKENQYVDPLGVITFD